MAANARDKAQVPALALQMYKLYPNYMMDPVRHKQTMWLYGGKPRTGYTARRSGTDPHHRCTESGQLPAQHHREQHGRKRP